ncbi:MAG: hypothetical protein WKF75_09525 [Singulisphaera sp.]
MVRALKGWPACFDQGNYAESDRCEAQSRRLRLKLARIDRKD